MKKLFYIILISFILLIGSIIIFLNSTNILNNIVNNFASDYNIVVGKISGNFIESINIDGIKYKNKEIFSKVKLKWNISSTILNKQITINNIKVDNFDIKNTLSLLKSLKSDNQNDSSSDVYLYINSVNITLNSYQKDDIKLDNGLEITLKRLQLRGDYLQLGKLNIDIPKLNYSSNIINQTALNANEILLNIKTKQIDTLFMDFESSINNNNISSNIECHKSICKLFNLINSPLSQNIILNTEVNIQDDIRYNGDLIVEDIESIPEDYRDIFKSFNIDFAGDLNYFNAHITSKSINSNITVQEFKLFNGYLKLNNLPKIPKEHIDYVKNLKIDFITDLKSFDANITSKAIKTTINSKDFENFKIRVAKPQKFKIDIKKKSSNLDIDIISKYINSKIVGNLDKNLHITLKGKSLGKVNKNLKDIKSIYLDIDTNLKKYTINNYKVLYKREKIFANKKSIINIKNSNINIQSFWVNDELLLKGNYNQSNQKGELSLNSKRFKLKIPKYINTNLIIDTNISIDGEKIAVDGGVKLDGGNISYTINNKPSFVLDKDIIFLKRKKKSTNKFMNNLSIELNILTEKSLKYRKKDININTKIYTHLSKKFDNDLKLFGQISLERGSRYIFRNKRLVISNSSINFTGALDKPILDIKAQYKNSDYRIKILVSGSPLNPSINFISTPYLSKEGILSILLLDSSGLGNSSNSTEDLQYLLGGAMAKSLLSNIGLKVEHFVISAGSLEIGKRVGDKIMVIYQKDKVSSVKVVYEHSKNIELDFMMNKESSSADIFYKGSF